MSVGANSAHEESVGMKHGEEGPSSAAAAAAGPSPAGGEESSAAAAGGGATASDQGGSFDCNICLELAQDPVVTLCGHLFCWPCLYRWLQMHSICQECPVCKASVEEEKVIPLYGRGKVNCVDPRTKAVPGLNIPHRPAGQRPETARQAEHQYPPQGFNFMAGSAGPAATARFGLGFDGERRFSEPVSGFFTEPLIFFNDEGWISNDEGGTFVNYDVNEAPFMDANGVPGDVDVDDGNEGPFVDANEGPPPFMNASREDGAQGGQILRPTFVDANEGPAPVGEESPNHGNEGPTSPPVTTTNFITEGPFVDAFDVLPIEGPSMEAHEAPVRNANEGPSTIANEVPTSIANNEVPPSIANEVPPPIANEVPSSITNEVPPPIANEVPPAIANEGPPAIANEVPPPSANEGPSVALPESLLLNKNESSSCRC